MNYNIFIIIVIVISIIQIMEHQFNHYFNFNLQSCHNNHQSTIQLYEYDNQHKPDHSTIQYHDDYLNSLQISSEKNYLYSSQFNTELESPFVLSPFKQFSSAKKTSKSHLLSDILVENCQKSNSNLSKQEINEDNSSSFINKAQNSSEEFIKENLIKQNVSSNQNFTSFDSQNISENSNIFQQKSNFQLNVLNLTKKSTKNKHYLLNINQSLKKIQNLSYKLSTEHSYLRQQIQKQLLNFQYIFNKIKDQLWYRIQKQVNYLQMIYDKRLQTKISQISQIIQQDYRQKIQQLQSKLNEKDKINNQIINNRQLNESAISLDNISSIDIGKKSLQKSSQNNQKVQDSLLKQLSLANQSLLQQIQNYKHQLYICEQAKQILEKQIIQYRVQLEQFYEIKEEHAYFQEQYAKLTYKVIQLSEQKQILQKQLQKIGYDDIQIVKDQYEKQIQRIIQDNKKKFEKLRVQWVQKQNKMRKDYESKIKNYQQKEKQLKRKLNQIDLELNGKINSNKNLQNKCNYVQYFKLFLKNHQTSQIQQKRKENEEVVNRILSDIKFRKNLSTKSFIRLNSEKSHFSLNLPVEFSLTNQDKIQSNYSSETVKFSFDTELKMQNLNKKLQKLRREIKNQMNQSVC